MKRRSWNCIIAPLGCQKISPGPTSSWIENRSSCRPSRRWSRFFASSRRRRYASRRSEEHTSDSSHVSISYAVFCLKKKKNQRRRFVCGGDGHTLHVVVWL